jgi:hypothetical protein
MSSLPLNLLKGASLFAITVALAGCTGTNSNSGGSVATTPPPQQTDQLAQLYGTGFAADFRMASTATPPVPMAGDIVPLSLTTQPNALF